MAYPTKTVHVRAGRDSQMYVYRVDRDGEPFVCCFCLLGGGESFHATTPAEMADHVEQHQTAGHRTPEGAADHFRQMAA